MKKLIILLFLFPTISFSQSGTFSVALTTTDSIVYDTPGAFMSIHGTIYNLSSTDSVSLSMEKQFIDIPVTWETAICTDICYPSTINSAIISLAPADSQEFVFYFYTDLVADSGYAKILYTNLNVPSNTVLHSYHGVTQTSAGILDMKALAFSVFPNPAYDIIHLKKNGSLERTPYVISDELGRVILSGKLSDNQSAISIEQLPQGFYFLNFGNARGSSVKIIKQ